MFRTEPAEPDRRLAGRPGWAGSAASLTAGVLLFTSFAPLGWWWTAIPAFVVLAVVLTRPATTVAGGFGYGFLCGLAFYLPLLPWISGLVGAVPWLVLAAVCAVFPGRVRHAGGRRAHAAGVAGVVRLGLGGLGVVQVCRSIWRIPLGHSGFRADERSATAVGATRWRAAGVGGDGVDRIQHRRARPANSSCGGAAVSSGITYRPRWCCQVSASLSCC